MLSRGSRRPANSAQQTTTAGHRTSERRARKECPWLVGDSPSPKRSFGSGRVVFRSHRPYALGTRPRRGPIRRHRRRYSNAECRSRLLPSEKPAYWCGAPNLHSVSHQDRSAELAARHERRGSAELQSEYTRQIPTVSITFSDKGRVLKSRFLTNLAAPRIRSERTMGPNPGQLTEHSTRVPATRQGAFMPRAHWISLPLVERAGGHAPSSNADRAA
jgi:hypothetical protein